MTIWHLRRGKAISAAEFGFGARFWSRYGVHERVLRGEACMTNAAICSWPLEHGQKRSEQISARGKKAAFCGRDVRQVTIARYYDAKATQNMLFGSAIISRRGQPPPSFHLSQPQQLHVRSSCFIKNERIRPAKKLFFPQSCMLQHLCCAAKYWVRRERNDAALERACFLWLLFYYMAEKQMKFS